MTAKERRRASKPPSELGMFLYPTPLKEGFKRDSHPSEEVAIWERLAAVYQECCTLHPDLNLEQRKRLFSFLMALDMGQGTKALDGLAVSILQDVTRAYVSEVPVHDLADDWSSSPVNNEAEYSGPQYSDTEHFPNDVPNHLIRKLIAIEKPLE